MSIRIHVVLSDDLAVGVGRVADDTESNKSEVIRKALHLLVAAHEGKARGLKLCLVHPETRAVETEIIGL